MENLLVVSIVIAGTWAAWRLLQVRRPTVRCEHVRIGKWNKIAPSSVDIPSEQ